MNESKPQVLLKHYLKKLKLPTILREYQAMAAVCMKEHCDYSTFLLRLVEEALYPKAVEPGVIEKIAAMASREHGDARKAVALLAKSAYLAEKAGTRITLGLVDGAATELGQDRYLTLLRSAPPQLQAAMGAIVEATRRSEHGSVGTGEAYDSYRAFCKRAKLRPLTGRAFGDLISELDIYSLLRSRVLSRGRYGRTREIILDLPQELTDKLYGQILLSFEMHGQSNQKKYIGEGPFETEQIA